MSDPELLEIVELSDGEVVLRRADSSEGTGEPLVRIRFSREARGFLGDRAGALGKSMIAAGLQMLGAIFARQDGAPDDDEPRSAGDETGDGVSDDEDRPAGTRLH